MLVQVEEPDLDDPVLGHPEPQGALHDVFGRSHRHRLGDEHRSPVTVVVELVDGDESPGTRHRGRGEDRDERLPAVVVAGER